jgi:hypothetical protein
MQLLREQAHQTEGARPLLETIVVMAQKVEAPVRTIQTTGHSRH